MKISYLELIFSSEKRRETLLLLREGPKTIEEIGSSLQTSPITIYPQIKLLKEKRFLFKDKSQKYELTSIGWAVTEKMKSLVDTVETLECKDKFWNSHKLDGIPTHLLNRISDLKNSTFAKPLDESSMFSSHPEFAENIAKSEFVKGISPFLHPLYPRMFLYFAEKGIDISLIVTELVFQRMRTEFRSEVAKFLSLENTHIYVYDKEMLLSCAVTNCFLSLGLFYKNGAYDHINDLISFEPEALRWGEELYHFYENLSTEIKEI